MKTALLKKLMVFWMVVACMLSHAYATETNNILEQVEGSARTWLALIDNEKYADGWQQASPLLQKKTPQQEWVKTVAELRKSRGTPNARYIATANSAKSLSGFPDGDYVILQFYTTFSEKGLALEAITLVKSNDTTDSEGWKIVEYSMR